jgi:DNA-binding response OmpR family regulator
MGTTTKGKKILIIEDELPLRTALLDILVFEEFTVLEAGNGEEGLACALKEHPDLILLDIVMPIMDGLTMFRKLRESGEYGTHVPVILLSNLSLYDEKVSKDINAMDPAFYLVKSNWSLQDVVKKVKGLLVRAVHHGNEQVAAPPLS